MDTIYEYPVHLRQLSDNKIIREGEGSASLDSRNLTLKIGEESTILPYFLIEEISDADYKININTIIDQQATLSKLGYDYESFLLNLYKLRGELLLRYMLMDEKNIAHDINSQFSYINEEGNNLIGECETRVYESALVILPQKAEPIRLPLCYIKDNILEDYKLYVATHSREKLTLSMMGEKTDYCHRSIKNAISDMILRAEKIFTTEEMQVDQGKIREAASHMGDGRAAKRSEIEEADPKLWTIIEKKLTEFGLQDPYRYLSRLSKGEVWVGIKRGLMGDRTGEYIWFMTPIYDQDPSRIGNALVLEAASNEDIGRATYFFRLTSRPMYNSGLSNSTLAKEASLFVDKLNRCMIEINFRREPIFLPLEKLATQEHERYLYAVNKMKSLKLLRQNYIGRVMHKTSEQWIKDTEELLRFNVESQRDTDKWRE